MEILSQTSLISAQISRPSGPSCDRSTNCADSEDQAAFRPERSPDTPPPRDEPVDRVETRNRAEDKEIAEVKAEEHRRSEGVGRREAPHASHDVRDERPGSRLDITV